MNCGRRWRGHAGWVAALPRVKAACEHRIDPRNPVAAARRDDGAADD